MTTTVTDPYLGSGDGGGTGPLPPTGGGGGGDGGGGDGGARRRRSKLPLVIALSVGVAVAVLVAVLATSKSATQIEDQANSILIGKPAPPIQGPLFTSGNSSGNDSLANHRGKWVLVNFFASWCVPCQQEQGDLVTFQNRHSAAGDAVIFGVRFNDPDDSAIRQLMNKSGAHWPIVDDVNAKFDWGVTGPPESFIVDPNGVVERHIVGQVNANELDTLLGQLEARWTPVTNTTPPSSAVAP